MGSTELITNVQNIADRRKIAEDEITGAKAATAINYKLELSIRKI
ncbi:hypothetical protein [[Clostridium] scindens]|nr:hypothetical protein [[Clostridium] scindens]